MTIIRRLRLILWQMASRRTKYLTVGMFVVLGAFCPTIVIHWPYSWQVVLRLDKFYGDNPGVVVTVLTGLTVFLMNYADRMTEKTYRAEKMFQTMYEEFSHLHQDELLAKKEIEIQLKPEDVRILDQLLSFTKFVLYNDVSYADLSQRVGPRYLQMYASYERLSNNRFENMVLMHLTIQDLRRHKKLSNIFLGEMRG